MTPGPTFEKVLSREMLDVLIRAGLVAALAIFCFRILAPFLHLLLWSVILAVTLYPMQSRLQSKIGWKNGRIATLIVLAAMAIVMVPLYLLGTSMTQSVQGALEMAKSGSFHIPPPADSVLGWPLVGRAVHGFWLQAAADLAGLVQKFGPQLRQASLALIATLGDLGLGLLTFVASLIVAGIVMAYGERGADSAIQIASRISGPVKGPRITRLCTATIRAVALGVVGIAFIQTILIGVALVLMGIPGAGLLSLAVLLLGIMQLPATLITLPVIAYVFITQGAGVTSVVFAVYVAVAGLADNVLKPLLLGRGVEVPMPVVLIGALGGMVVSGVIGLFIGPVILAIGYQLFWQWVADEPDATDAPTQAGPAGVDPAIRNP